MNIKVVTPKLGASSLAHTPVELPRLTAGESGLNFNYRNLNEVSPSSVRLFSIFHRVSGGQRACKLLLFIVGERRPFVIDGFKIQYSDFKIPRADTVVPQLRGFGHFLCQASPGVSVDRSTYDFLAGGVPTTLDKDVVALATALGGVLQQVDESRAR